MNAVDSLINDALERTRVTQAALAEAVGVSQPTVHKWRTGLSQPREEYWPAIEHFLDLPSNTLAHAAGRIIVSDAQAEGIAPTILQAARDMAALDAEDQATVKALIDRLSRQ